MKTVPQQMKPAEAAPSKNLTPDMQKAAADNPFDQFDAQGKPLASVMPAAKASEEEEEAEYSAFAEKEEPSVKEPTTIFDKWFGTWDSEKTAEASPQNTTNTIRKPFTNTVVVPDEPIPQPLATRPSAARPVDVPSGTVPVMLSDKSEEKTISAFKSPVADSEMIDTPSPVQEAKNEPSFFDRMSESFKSITGEEPDVEKSDEPFPSLSSVPPKSEQFEAVKENKQQMLDELQAAHNMASEERESLAAEPSQQAATAVAETAPVMTPAPVTGTAPAVPEPKVSMKKSGNEPTLLGQMTQSKSAADSVKPEIPMVNAPMEISKENASEPSKEDAAAVEENAGEKTSWWNRWSKAQNTDLDTQPTEATPQAVLEATAVSVGEAKHPEAAEEYTAPYTAPTAPAVSAPAPLLAKPEPQTEPVKTAEEKKEDKIDSSAADETGLPSPQILKTLPPSRYNNMRAGERNFYLVP
jgi:hypothetical protein